MNREQIAWTILREMGGDLADRLEGARAGERPGMVLAALHGARGVLGTLHTPEAVAVRELLVAACRGLA